ncbi:MAG: SNF2 family DNA or RNA helicase [Oceanospirillaceae bacterium]|jgi:SNF2 family DNA or RNA helicase
MQFIHLFWQPRLDVFDNSGQLYLWIEQANIEKPQGISSPRTLTSNDYPYQANSQKLIDFGVAFLKNVEQQLTPCQLSVQMPCNSEGDPIASSVITNILDLEDCQFATFRCFSLNVLQISQPLTFLKELNFISYHFEDDTVLAGDAQFWIKMAYELSGVIKKDQYVPKLFLANSGTKKTYNDNSIDSNEVEKYHTKWQLVSAGYGERLSIIAKHMPSSACLGEFSEFEQESTLQHFSDVLLNDIVNNTVFTQKTYKSVSNSFVEQALDSNMSDISEEAAKATQLWQNNLQADQFGNAFVICFKLLEASTEDSNDWGLELLLQSKLDPSFMVNLVKYWQDKSQKVQLYHKMFGSSIERTILLQLGYACRVYPLIETAIEQLLRVKQNRLTKSVSRLTITLAQAFDFLKEDAWALHASGYRIIVPAWWTTKGRIKAKLKLRVRKSTGDSSTDNNAINSQIGSDNLIKFDYRYALGNHEVSADQWQQLLQEKADLVYFRGAWIELDHAEMKNMQSLIETSERDMSSPDLQTLLRYQADDLYDVQLDGATQRMVEGLQDQEKLTKIAVPDNLNATLRPYQQRGLSWLAYLENLGMNPCLADDMGLGKTMQIIALMLAKPKQQTALLIVPTSVMGNWYKELAVFAPSIKAFIHHGAKRKQQEKFNQMLAGFQIVITSFGLIRKDKQLFKNVHWSRVIVDEAQNIKNPSSAQSKVIFSLKADTRFALTGTPVENRLMDLWSIFNFLNPGLLGKQSSFRKNFELPVQRDNNRQQGQLLKKMVEPFILRRLKTDKNIIADLPGKIEQKVYCGLSVEQATIYQSIVNEISDQMVASVGQESQQKVIMLTALLRLKQCCNHPAQVLQDGSEFSLERSVKLQRLVESVKEAINNGESLLVFSQFTEICQQLQGLLKNQYGYNVHYLHGGTSAKRRQQMIEQFQDADAPPSIFVLSLKAGGVGITLTKANHVIHFDRWWNPAVENQATDRAYRIGQTKTVFAHKYITLGTVEERIDKMLDDKQGVADSVVGSDESWLSKLDAESFIELIQLSQSS